MIIFMPCSVVELNNWRQIILRTFERIVSEINALQEEKDITERELAALSSPIAVISEVLTMRDCRLGAELTYDEPDTEVKNELRILENNQRLLAERCQKAWSKLTRLEEVRFKIGLEIENKVEAVDLDTVQLALNRNSAGISYKPNPNYIHCRSGECNGIALWVDWQLTAKDSPKSVVSTGPVEPVVPGQFVKWDMFVRQGVHFTNQKMSTKDAKARLDWSTTFRPVLGDLSFNFSLFASHEKCD